MPRPLPAVDATLPFTAPALLAPMEGVTEPCFRDLVLAANPSSALGGAYTEFVRVVQGPVPKHVLRAHLGSRRFAAPVGLQLMGSDLASLAETAHRAFEVGAPLVDLNFGCPAKGAIRTCAGSALLRDPAAVERIVAACVAAAGGRPVSAKIRAGYDDAERVEDLARAVESGGAVLLTVHCRTRAEAYQDEVDWRRIERAVRAVTIPVCGNGGVVRHTDLARMRAETGCRFTMVGRAALGDPWIFAGARVTPACAARFLLDYAELLVATRAAGRAGAAGRTKQLLRFWTAGDLLGPDPTSWIRERDPERLFARLAEIAGAERAGPLELARSERGFDAPCTVPKKAAPFAPHDRRRHLECPPQIMENS